MGDNKLNKILDKHRKWLNHEEGGERANLSDSNLRHSNLNNRDLCRSNLRGADLRHSDLRHSNPRGADLRHSDLREADIDYSAWPLWCGSLKAYVDDRIAIQLLYHTLSVVQHSPYVSDELKRALLTPGNIDAANRFHHVGECGKLEVYNDGNTI